MNSKIFACNKIWTVKIALKKLRNCSGPIVGAGFCTVRWCIVVLEFCRNFLKVLMSKQALFSLLGISWPCSQQLLLFPHVKIKMQVRQDCNDEDFPSNWENVFAIICEELWHILFKDWFFLLQLFPFEF